MNIMNWFISVFIYLNRLALAHKLFADRYLQILLIYPHVNSSNVLATIIANPLVHPKLVKGQ